LENTVVRERNLPEKWGTHRGSAGFDVSSAERKGKAGPLEAGRGKHSPLANPERVTSEALKRRDNGILLGKPESEIVSIGYKSDPSKIQETPVI
jgi:hypothetical protein